MPLVTNERLESRRLFEINGTRYGERRFVITDDEGAQVTADDALASLPAFFTVWPGNILMQVYDREVTPQPGFLDQYEGLVKYRDVEIGQEFLSEQVGYVQYIRRSRGQLVNWWRRPAPGLNLPALGLIPNLGFTENTDIGGRAIDVAGVPTGFNRPQINIQFMVVTEQLRDMSGGLLEGTRNDDAFFGAPAGSLLYVGSVDQPIQAGNKRLVIYEFVWDDFFHLVQVCDRDPDGLPIVTEVPAVSTNFPVAANVTWRQPFNALSDFETLDPHLTNYVQSNPPSPSP